MLSRVSWRSLLSKRRWGLRHLRMLNISCCCRKHCKICLLHSLHLYHWPQIISKWTNQNRKSNVFPFPRHVMSLFHGKKHRYLDGIFSRVFVTVTFLRVKTNLAGFLSRSPGHPAKSPVSCSRILEMSKIQRWQASDRSGSCYLQGWRWCKYPSEARKMEATQFLTSHISTSRLSFFRRFVWHDGHIGWNTLQILWWKCRIKAEKRCLEEGLW